MSQISSKVAASWLRRATGLSIVVDSWEHEAVKTSDPVSVLKTMILRQLGKGNAIVGLDGENVTQANIDQQLAQASQDAYALAEAFSGFLVASSDDEGAEGIGVGFSSGDRAEFAFPWPPPEDPDEFYGNGDPMVYKTTGISEGQAVQGVEMYLDDDNQIVP